MLIERRRRNENDMRLVSSDRRMCYDLVQVISIVFQWYMLRALRSSKTCIIGTEENSLG